MKKAKELYEEHSANKPYHSNGLPRKTWDELSATTKYFWKRKEYQQKVNEQQ